MHYRSSDVFSLGGWTPQFPTGLACPVVLRILRSAAAYVYGTITRSGGLSHGLPLRRSQTLLESCNPARRTGRFGLFRFRSPLLAESSLFLGLLRCFSSPGSLPTLAGGCGITRSGFPHSDTPGCSRLHTPDRGLSQCTTSFIGIRRLGILRMPLVAFPHL